MQARVKPSAPLPPHPAGDRIPAGRRTDSAEALFQRARAFHDSLRLEEALACYLKAIELKPDFSEACFNAALVYQHQDRTAEAVALYRRVLRDRPEHAQALNNLGRVLLATGDWQRARECFERALQSRPDFAEPCFNLGDLCRLQGQPQEAIDWYRRAVGLNPSMGEAWNNLGNALRQRGVLAEAIGCYRHVVRLQPRLAQGHYNLGSSLREAGRLEEAAQALVEAVRLKPDYAEAHNNLGLAWKAYGAGDLAAKAFTAALQIDPDLAEARWNRSLFNLMNGNFADGWHDYEWRNRIPQWPLIYPHRLKLPRWEGDTDKTKTVLVHDEQGFGDTLQFVRYLPMVKARCGRVVLETRDELMGLLRAFPGADEVVVRPRRGEPPAAADACVPLLSLPRLFGTTLASIPADVPYLQADHLQAARWAERLAGPEFKIGIVWAGRPEHQNDRNRSCALGLFAPFTRIPGVRLVGLQKGPAAVQAQAEPFASLMVNWGDELLDFADTAAAISGLDLILSVDTAVVHLAGALGKPVWVLLSFVSDWRWMTGRDDSPWYPTMRLFRQVNRQGWAPVFARLEYELRRLAADRP